MSWPDIICFSDDNVFSILCMCWYIIMLATSLPFIPVTDITSRLFIPPFTPPHRYYLSVCNLCYFIQYYFCESYFAVAIIRYISHVIAMHTCLSFTILLIIPLEHYFCGNLIINVYYCEKLFSPWYLFTIPCQWLIVHSHLNSMIYSQACLSVKGNDGNHKGQMGASMWQVWWCVVILCVHINTPLHGKGRYSAAFLCARCVAFGRPIGSYSSRHWRHYYKGILGMCGNVTEGQ